MAIDARLKVVAPGAVLIRLPHPLSEKTQRELREAWDRAYRGPRNSDSCNIAVYKVCHPVRSSKES